MAKQEFTNYEKTRILGARALQIAMDAPYLKEIPEKKLEEINYDPMEIAKEELEAGVLPITVNQPMPAKRSVKIKKTVKEDPKETKAVESDAEVKAKEVEEEKDIEEEGEIMELANPQDEESEEQLEGRAASEELQ